MKKIGNFPDLLSDLLGKIFPFRAGSFQTQPDTRMRAGGWLVLAVLAGAAVAVPQEVSPLGSAVAGDLEIRARWGTHLPPVNGGEFSLAGSARKH